MKIIKKVDKRDLKNFLYDINIEDKNLYIEANNPDSVGIFQLNGDLAAKIIKKVKPSNFDEINAVSAFARPGTSSFVDQYVKNRDKNISQYPKKVQELLKDTNSIILFQEQTMAIFNKIGGFTLEETNYIRGLMKKLGKANKSKEDLMAWERVIDKFINGAKENGIKASDAKKIADDLLKMSSYSFNRSHSSSYTYIAVQTLYLSYYFRKYFYSSVLHYEVERGDYLLEKLKAVKKQEFKIEPPDINKSKMYVSPIEDNTIIFGLSEIKGVGENPAKAIVENQPYKNLIDLIIKTQGKRVTSSTIKALIGIGAFDNIEVHNRNKLLEIFNLFWSNKKSTKVPEKLMLLWKEAEKEIEKLNIKSGIEEIRLLEKKLLGFNFFITPFNDNFIKSIDLLVRKNLAYKDFDSVKAVSLKVPVLVNKIKVLKDRNKNEMAFLEIEDINGVVKSIPIFHSFWNLLKPYFVEGKVHMINLYLTEDGEIMFGRRKYIRNDSEILRLVKLVNKL